RRDRATDRAKHSHRADASGRHLPQDGRQTTGRTRDDPAGGAVAALAAARAADPLVARFVALAGDARPRPRAMAQRTARTQICSEEGDADEPRLGWAGCDASTEGGGSDGTRTRGLWRDRPAL